MDIDELLLCLQRLQIKLAIDKNGQLKFSGPKGAVTNELLQSLKQYKSKLIELLQLGNSAIKNDDKIPSLSSRQNIDLSFSQKRFWLLDQIVPGCPAYNIPIMLKIKGILNIEALEISLNKIIKRHEILRTGCITHSGKVVQNIENVSVNLEFYDFTKYLSPDKDLKIQEIIKEKSRYSFSLEKPPLMSASLMQISMEENLFLIVMHHFIADGWSINIFAKELIILYQSYLIGEEPPLKKLPIQYADYSNWQGKRIDNNAYALQLDYWRDRLRNAKFLTELPLDFPKQTIPTFNGKKEKFTINPLLKAELLAISAREGVTLFVLLLSAFQLLLYRYKKQDFIVTGIPISNRTNIDTEGLIGPFSNNILICTNFNSKMTFVDLLQQVKKNYLDAMTNQELPVEIIIDDLQKNNIASGFQLLQVMFVMHQELEAELNFGGLNTSIIKVDNETAQFDLNFNIFDDKDGLVGILEYNISVFTENTISELLKSYTCMLEGISCDSQLAIHEYSIVTPTDLKKILKISSNFESKYDGSSIPEIFEDNVHKFMNAKAIQFNKSVLSYSEINKLSNQLARYLISNGANTNSRIGVCFERSDLAVISMLAILKLAAAYVPIDSSLPLERQLFILNDSNISIVITQESLADSLPSTNLIRKIICLDSDMHRIDNYSCNNLNIKLDCNSLAYIIYTSGSTGQPKCIPITHRGVTRLITGTNFLKTLIKKEIFLQFSSISFDASTYEIWGCLLRGGLLVIFPPGMPSLVEFKEFIKINQINTLWLTAGFFHQLVESNLAELDSLRCMVVGGDVISPKHVSKALEQLPQCTIVNGYGPTECTTFTCCYIINRGKHLKTYVPIGYPITNTSVFILDTHQNPVPIGIVGELCVGGSGLSWGYLNRPDLTSEKFIPNRFSNLPGDRLYRTGDLAKYNQHGEIEFLGRLDNQVKIRGYRVELEEIENALRQHPSVTDVTVLAIKDNEVPLGDEQIVAYLVLKSYEHLESIHLNIYLKSKVPNYMIPSKFIVINEMPLNINGKVDKKKLLLCKTIKEDDKQNTRSENPIEELLVGIWCNVLKTKFVSIYDNFFELGGHSLLATQAVSRIKDVFKIDVPLRVFFEANNLSVLSKHIESAILANEACLYKDVPLIACAESENAPLSFAQQRLWFLDQLEHSNAAYNIPIALICTGVLDEHILKKSLNEILKRHSALRTSFMCPNEIPIQLVNNDFKLEIKKNILYDNINSEKINSILLEESAKPFDLAKDILIRVTQFVINENNQILLIVMHHIISDGWSMGIFVKELMFYYNAFLSKREISLPELPIQYVDFAFWQKNLLEKNAFSNSLDYWGKKLDGLQPVFNLPISKPRPRVQTFGGEVQTFTISKNQVEQLLTISKKESCTLFMILLSVYNILLYKYTGLTDIAVGSPIANRNRPETENLIGFFVNTIILRNEFDPMMSFKTLLKIIRQTTLEAYENQDVPFEQIVEKLQPARSLGHTPFTQLRFILQNSPVDDISLQNLKVTPTLINAGFSKFDITFALIESDNGLLVTVEYCVDLFEKDSIKRLINHYVEIIKEVIENPNIKICDINILSQEEKDFLLPKNNSYTKLISQNVCNLFVTASKKYPKYIAVKDEIDELTYEHLDLLTNKYACFLNTQECLLNQHVAIILERSIDMVIAIISILKAGGIYVPIDPKLPRKRIENIIKTANAKLILTNDNFKFSKKIVNVKDSIRNLSKVNNFNLNVNLDSNQIAYTMFTSGTTGTPKGVCITHASLDNYVKAISERLNFGAGKSILSFGSPGSDLWNTALFGALCIGGTLRLISEEKSIEPLFIAEELLRASIDHIKIVPSHFKFLISEIEPQKLLPKDTLIFGGEPLEASLIKKLKKLSLDCSFVNHYGPTETTIGVLTHKIDDISFDSNIPIGKALSNIHAYVLNNDLQPVPIGVTGELFVSGPCLAVGYLGKSDLTANSFIPNPFLIGERMYSTGDQVKYLVNGDIEYQGRRDDQIKIRGYRVELNEVTSILRSQKNVEDAVAIHQPNTKGEAEIVAYLVTNKAHEITQKRFEKTHITTWKTFYSEYEREASGIDHEVNFAGWISTYTNKPIPEEEMLESFEETVRRIKKLRPKKILEIGCGHGMLLFRLISHVDRYTGIDFSNKALNYIREHLHNLHEKEKLINLINGDAEIIKNFEKHGFDTVIINSVIQYFPSVEYLFQVIKDAVDCLKEGGTIFIGDVRNYQLLQPFYCSVEFYKASLAGNLNELQQNIFLRKRNEKELTVDQKFFLILEQLIPKISYVEITPKQSKYVNEISKYRYDVIIYVGKLKEKIVDIKWLNWDQENMHTDLIIKYVKDDMPDYLGIKNVPNHKLKEDIKITTLINSKNTIKTISNVMQSLQSEPADNFCDLVELKLLKELPYYNVNLCWKNSGSEGRYDLILIKNTLRNILVSNYKKAIEVKPLRFYGNSPLRLYYDTIFINNIKEKMKDCLPNYMLPATYTLMEKLPLLPNGKLDRYALPKNFDKQSTSSYSAPKTIIEKNVVEVFSEILNINRIGTNDNFFELGGHSLLATQVISRLKNVYSIEIPVRAIFECPTVLELSQKVEILLNAASCRTSLPINPFPRNTYLPLSFAQQRLWFLSQLEGPSTTYNRPMSVILKGKLHVDILEETLKKIISRHEILRTVFIETEQGPGQCIRDFIDFEFFVIDFSQECILEDKKNLEQRIIERIQSESQYLFDLSKGPLIRAKLLKKSEDEYVLIIVMHHIISDGWSIGIFINEFSEIYKALVLNKIPSLPELSIQYADFAAWQREWLKENVLLEQLNYWENQLKSAPQLLNMPTDKPRPSVHRNQGLTEIFTIPNKLIDAAHRFCRNYNVTLFMLMIAVFKVLLAKYSGQSDILVGVPIANRNKLELENLIGFFVNTLVIRSKIDDNKNFIETLNEIKGTTLDAYANQDLPFEHLVEVLNPARSLSYSPLFQVMFILQNAPLNEIQLPNLKVEPGYMDYVISKFDLILQFHEDNKGLIGRLEYNTDLFTRKTILKIIEHYQLLLNNLIGHPNRKISNIEYVTKAEYKNLVYEKNQLPFAYKKQELIHKLFEVQVVKSPHSIAISDGDISLTYVQLNEKSNKIAHHLIKKGVKTGTLVGVYLDRSPEFIIAILGILKAGGAYVPIDTNYPLDRVNFILKDTNSPVLVTQEKYSKNVSLDTYKVIMDLHFNIIDNEPDENINIDMSHDDLAYVIYTSGSTGKPKGVMCRHLSVCCCIMELQHEFKLCTADVVLQHISIGFDISIEEVFHPLLTGAKLCILPPNLHKDPRDLMDVVYSRKVTTLHLVPSMLKSILESVEAFKFVYLKHVIVGGEALLPEITQEFYFKLNSNLYNVYGPTEMFYVTIWNCKQQNNSPTVPIGKPVGDNKMYILDRNLQLVPENISGELYISGTHLSRGYFNRPELTAEKYLPDPFNAIPGSRMYKTGDLVSWLHDGSIRFIGRTDFQVKLRGYRIELGEIESVIRKHPNIIETAVVAREDIPGNKYLAAYFTASRNDEENIIEQLKNEIKVHLPDYMMPSIFIKLDDFPLSQNGKINRNAFPKPIQKQYNNFEEKDEFEAELINIWQKLLCVDGIGVNDNFFELGGHSLLAVKMMVDIQKKYGINLSVSLIFHDNTLKGLAKQIKFAINYKETYAESALVCVRTGSLERLPLFFIHPVGGSVFCYRELASVLNGERAFYGIQAAALTDEKIFHESIEEMAKFYLSLIQQVQPNGPYYLGGWSLGGIISIEVARILLEHNEKVAFLGLIDTHLKQTFPENLSLDKTLLLSLAKDIGIAPNIYDLEKYKNINNENILFEILNKAKMEGLLPMSTTIIELQKRFEILRRNAVSFMNYEPKFYDGEIYLFKAKEKIDHLEKKYYFAWSSLCKKLNIISVPGNHYTAVRNPNVIKLAKSIDAQLEQCEHTINSAI